MLRSYHILQLAVIALLAVGVVMVHSAGLTVNSHLSLTEIFTSRAAIYALIAIMAMLFASRINIRQLLETRGIANPLPWIIGIGLVLVTLVLIPGVGRNVNGSRRWLNLGPFLSFQPSEVMKWAMILAIAYWASRRQGVMHTFKHGLLPPLLLLGACCLLIVKEDLGTATLIGAVAVCMLIAGGAKWWHIFLLLPPAAIGVIAAIMHTPYRRERILSFMNPWADPQGNGYHPIQSMLAITQGGLFGRGLGNGIQKFGYLPEDTTDFIFAILAEETGLAGVLLVIGLYLVILWTGFDIIQRSKDTFGRLVALGVLLTVGFQALINIAVVTVVVPTKGIALPLISSGGTGWIMTAFALGLVASLDVAHQLETESEAEAQLADDQSDATAPDTASTAPVAADPKIAGTSPESVVTTPGLVPANTPLTAPI